MGAMDARWNQKGITCDSAGVRSYTVGDIQHSPGVSRAVGGDFRWDVAVVRVDPYQVIAASPFRVLKIGSSDSGDG